ncbi:unnamed protein product [Rotaria magnacalcarata]|uniref:Uncharacterized protein n=1 Tax=Rotaria magnacalcarata TaxID=392030 RepID=A0A819XXI3_9BILA|nr:unnamed protein product [Rotaria magnacalcarata]CAF4149287.1 unnamed protein product [Rotaria magnacalcarata]
MSRRRSTSSIHDQVNQNSNYKPCYNPQKVQNNSATSEVYLQAYLALIDDEHYQDDILRNGPVPNHCLIPPPHRNNLKPVNSPLRRPHSTNEDELSELDDFIQDPTTKSVHNNHKKEQIAIISLYKTIRIDHKLPTKTTYPQVDTDSLTTNTLTNETKTFAQTRYPYPPFIIRFLTPLIQEQNAADELCKFLKDNKQIALKSCGFHKSTSKCLSNECDLLLFVKTSCSFSVLYDENNWPRHFLA